MASHNLDSFHHPVQCYHYSADDSACRKMSSEGWPLHVVYLILLVLSMLANWFRAGPPMLKATHPRAGRARVAMMPTRLSPAASCATSDAACALPADAMVAAAVLHAATLMICSCTNSACVHATVVFSAIITTLVDGAAAICFSSG